jgi:hypothetical protein
MEKIKELLEEKFSQYDWDKNPIQIEYLDHTEEYPDVVFNMDIESVLEYSDNIIDENIKIECEITFESEQEIFCQIYTDLDLNVNRLILIID